MAANTCTVPNDEWLFAVVIGRKDQCGVSYQILGFLAGMTGLAGKASNLGETSKNKQEI